MNARQIAFKVLASLTFIAALSSLSGCVVRARAEPARYHVYYR